MSIQRNALPGSLINNVQCAVYQEDFFSYTNASEGGYTFYDLGGAGSAAWSGSPIDSNSGQTDSILITTKAVALDAAGLYQTNPNLLQTLTEGAMFAEAYIYSEGVHAAGTSMQYFGLASTHVIAPVTAIDPTASYTGAIIYKLSGDAYWRTQVSVGTAKTTTICSNVPVVEGANKFRIDILKFDGSNWCATFSVNNHILLDVNNITIAPKATYTSAAAMGLIALFESDANAAAQTGQIDYWSSGRYRCMLNS